MTVTIQASSGSLRYDIGAAEPRAINQVGDTVTITGDLTNVNNALDNGITYTPAVGVTSNTLSLSVTDGSGDSCI